MSRGVWCALCAYTIWGFIPIYLKWLNQVPALEIVGHRIIWSCLMLCAYLLATRSWRNFLMQIPNFRVIGAYLAAAILLSANWLVYVWAVNANFIVDASLGYFINPLISVLFGVLLLKERLRSWQWLAVGLALAGVIYLTWAHGSLPWIALVLAFSFALYGLIKKTSPLGALPGLTLETGILFLPGMAYLLFAEFHANGAFLHRGAMVDILLIGCGLVTAVPLLLFAAAAQRIPLALVGLLQYIGPTLQFLIGVLIYDEPFTSDKFIGFGLVWVALLIFAFESFLHRPARAVQMPQVIEA
ncbi:MAG: EamA family transporter RarD [Betaproteobacteria bacterium]|nr:EamA family transporter RarD [Betaproteobacteria bacterium]